MNWTYPFSLASGDHILHSTELLLKGLLISCWLARTPHKRGNAVKRMLA